MAATPKRARAAQRVNGAEQSRRQTQRSAISVTIGRTIDASSETKKSRRAATVGGHPTPVLTDAYDVLEMAFTRCEAHDAGGDSAACPIDPSWICSGCGTLVCAGHAIAADGRVSNDRATPCPACGAAVLDLRSAAVDVVLDARLRRHPN